MRLRPSTRRPLESCCWGWNLETVGQPGGGRVSRLHSLELLGELGRLPSYCGQGRCAHLPRSSRTRRGRRGRVLEPNGRYTLQRSFEGGVEAELHTACPLLGRLAVTGASLRLRAFLCCVRAPTTVNGVAAAVGRRTAHGVVRAARTATAVGGRGRGEEVEGGRRSTRTRGGRGGRGRRQGSLGTKLRSAAPFDASPAPAPSRTPSPSSSRALAPSS